MAEPLLEVHDLAKRFGPVIALRSAEVVVEPGEVHALLGANGAGKTTLVKILTGVVQADSGSIKVNGKAVRVHSPAQAARIGLAPVFQDPALVPDLTVAANLHMTGTDVRAVRRELDAMELTVDFNEFAGDVPLPMLRMIDLARALAREPELLLLDEITAALPSDLAERVFAAMRVQRERGRSVLFITHRLNEVIQTCDRATIFRDGGRRDDRAAEGSEETIVAHMLGEAVARAAVEATERPADSAPVGAPARAVPALDVQALTVAGLHGVSFSLAAGEVLGIAALEGQGQDELFNALAGATSLASGEIHVAGRPLKARHPYDAIRAGVVLVPADRLHALLPQRSVRENIAAPRYNSVRRWGPISMAKRAASCAKRSRRCRSTRAPRARFAGSPEGTSRR